MASDRPHAIAPAPSGAGSPSKKLGRVSMASDRPHAIAPRSLTQSKENVVVKRFQWPLIGHTQLRLAVICPGSSAIRTTFQWPLIGHTQLRQEKEKDRFFVR